MSKETAEKDVLPRNVVAVELSRACGVRNLLAKFRGHVFVGVEEEHPLSLDAEVCQRPVLLLRVALPRLLGHVRPGLLRQLSGLVNASRIEHVNRPERGGGGHYAADMQLLVKRRDDDRDAAHRLLVT